MISPKEALEIVLANTPRLEAVEVPLVESTHAVLAEPIVSDIDLPPFDKSAMDGFAARLEDLAKPPVELRIVEELPAGKAPTKHVTPGTCVKIMTGAPVPRGADVVIPVEDTQPAGVDAVCVLRADAARRNICTRGEDIHRGEQVIAPGAAVRPQEIGLLASVGRGKVRVYRRPRVAVLATGDELVEVSAVPGPGQIRNANSSSLLASCRKAGVDAVDLGVARDEERDLRERISRGLEHDVLLVSGGVSMGEWDLVPKVFDVLGVTVHFSTVRMKPGKPTMFATQHARGSPIPGPPNATNRVWGPPRRDWGPLIFGLPGNPVSTLVAFRLFVWPSLRKMMGHPEPVPPVRSAVLLKQLGVGGDRVTYVPAVLCYEDGKWTASALRTKGPADLVGFCRANALLVLEPGRYEQGASVEALPLEM